MRHIKRCDSGDNNKGILTSRRVHLDQCEHVGDLLVLVPFIPPSLAGHQ
jgi:hypothetical protein